MTDQTIEAETPTGSALIVIPASSLPTLVEADKSDIIGRLRAELAGYIPDASTETGRAEIGTKARKVGTAKQDFGRLAATLKADHQATIKSINTELKLIEDDCDAIRDGILAPRTEYLNRQKAIVTANEAQIATMEALTDGLADLSSADIKARYQSINSEFEWAPEFIQRASRVQNGVIAQLQVAHQAAKGREAIEAAEAALHAEEAERERLATIEAQKAHEAAIAAEATRLAEIEAEYRRQRDAEAAHALLDAAVERERLAEESADLLRMQAQVERVATHQRALQYIKSMIADACSPFNDSNAIRHITKVMDGMAEMTRNWEEFHDEADALIANGRAQITERLAVAIQQEADHAETMAATRLAQEQEAAAAQLTAALDAERQRVADEKAEAERLAAKREANVAHQRKINGEVVADILKALPSIGALSPEESKEIAVEIMKAIARKEVRHVGAIQY